MIASEQHPDSARDRFLDLLRASALDGSLVKLTLGKCRGPDPTLRNLFVRPISLKAGYRLSLVWRHSRRDITKNLPADRAIAEIKPLIGSTFLDAHLFTSRVTAQLETRPDGSERLRVIHPKEPAPRNAASSAPHEDSACGERDSPSHPVSIVPDCCGGGEPELRGAPHDAPRHYPIPATTGWLKALGVTGENGRPREGMTGKFRQIQRFADILSHLLDEAFPEKERTAPLIVNDMGSGKGYLTFAAAELLGRRARVRGTEVRPELVQVCNRVAQEYGMSPQVEFLAGTIADVPLEGCDVLIALHACDTATDDALARGISAGAKLLVVAPCCHKELRPQLRAPPVLGDALRHGIFRERQAEFVTDGLRAQLLEWAGYRTRVFEFVSTEHTPKNLMISAIGRKRGPDESVAARTRAFAAFYGIHTQRLAQHLGFTLSEPPPFVPELPK